MKDIESLGYAKHQGSTVIFDVDGTVIREDGPNSKAIAIPKLEAILVTDPASLAASGDVSLEEARTIAKTWLEIRNKFLGDERYYGRFFTGADSRERAAKADTNTQNYVVYEGMKARFPAFSKRLGKIMTSLIESGEVPILPYEDAVATIIELVRRNVRVGTYSGGPADIQRLMLSKVPVVHENSTRRFTNLAEILEDEQTGVGMRDKSFGSKMDEKSYRKLFDELAEKRSSLVYVTDGEGEANVASRGIPQFFYKTGGDFSKKSGIVLVDNDFRGTDQQPRFISGQGSCAVEVVSRLDYRILEFYFREIRTPIDDGIHSMEDL